MSVTTSSFNAVINKTTQTLLNITTLITEHTTVAKDISVDNMRSNMYTCLNYIMTEAKEVNKSLTNCSDDVKVYIEIIEYLTVANSLVKPDFIYLIQRINALLDDVEKKVTYSHTHLETLSKSFWSDICVSYPLVMKMKHCNIFIKEILPILRLVYAMYTQNSNEKHGLYWVLVDIEKYLTCMHTFEKQVIRYYVLFVNTIDSNQYNFEQWIDEIVDVAKVDKMVHEMKNNSCDSWWDRMKQRI